MKKTDLLNGVLQPSQEYLTYIGTSLAIGEVTVILAFCIALGAMCKDTGHWFLRSFPKDLKCLTKEQLLPMFKHLSFFKPKSRIFTYI